MRVSQSATRTALVDELSTAPRLASWLLIKQTDGVGGELSLQDWMRNETLGYQRITPLGPI